MTQILPSTIGHPGPWRIEKLGYSVGPWRIIDANGHQLYGMRADWREGFPPYPAPLGFPTKTAAIEGLGALAAELYERIPKIRPA